MSWLGGYKKLTESDLREARRQKLEADRIKRQQDRELRKKQIQEAQLAQQQLGEEIDSLLAINPDILSGESVNVSAEEAERLLSTLDQETPEEASIMDFDAENGADGANAMDKMSSVKCEFTREDIEFWFTELETQLEVIEVKSQWSKRIALQ